MPVAASVPDAPRRLPWGCIWVSAAGAAPRSLLRRLLLDADGTFVCGRRYERALDRAPRVAHSFGEAFSIRALDLACCRRYFSRCRSVVVIFWKWRDWPLGQNDPAQVHQIVDDAAVPLTVAQPTADVVLSFMEVFMTELANWHIRQGHYSDINLDGLSFVRVGRWEGDLWAGKAKGSAGIFIDDRADERQA